MIYVLLTTFILLMRVFFNESLSCYLWRYALFIIFVQHYTDLLKMTSSEFVIPVFAHLNPIVMFGFWRQGAGYE